MVRASFSVFFFHVGGIRQLAFYLAHESALSAYLDSGNHADILGLHSHAVLCVAALLRTVWCTRPQSKGSVDQP